MHQIEPKPNATITHENTRLKVVISNDCHECYFEVNNIDCTHIKCSKNEREDNQYIILKEDENRN